MAETVGEGQIVIGADTSNLDTDLEKKVSKSAKKGGGFFSSGFGKAVKVGVLGTAAAVGAAAGTLVGTAMTKGFARAGAIEDAQAKLRGLGHDGESVAAIMQNVKDSVTGTAYGLGEATTVAATMVAAGIKPGEQLTKTLATLADTAAITGRGFDDMGSIFGKMAANGKLSGEELAQLTDSGLPVLQMLQDKYKLTREEAQRWVKDGKVSFEMFRELMEDNIGTAAENAGQTFSGASANIQAALGRLGEKFAKPIMDTMRDSFNAAIPALNSVGELLDPLAEKFGTVLADQVLPRVVGGLEALPDLLTRTSDGLSGVSSILKDGDFTSEFARAFNVEEDSPVVGVLFGIRDAVGDVWEAAKDFFDGFVEGFGGMEKLGDSLLPVFTVLGGPLGILKTVLLDLFGKIDFEKFGEIAGSVFGQLSEVIVKLSGVITGIVSDVLSRVIPVVGEIIEKLLPIALQLIEDLTPIIVDVVEMVGEFATELLDKLVPVLMDLIESVLPPVMDLIAGLVPVITEVLDAVLPLVDTILTGLIPVFEMIVEAIAPVITQLVEMLVPIILEIVDTVLPPLIDVFEAVGDILTTVVLPILSTVVDFLAKTFTDTFNNLKPLIETVFDFIKRTIDNVMNVIKGIIDVVLGVISGDWGRAWDGIKRVAGAIWDQIKNVISTSLNLIKGYIKFFIDQVTSVWSNFWGMFKGVGESAWNWIRDTALGVWDSLARGTADAFNGIKDAIQRIWGGIKEVIGKPINVVIGFINKGVIGAYNTVAGFLKMQKLGEVAKLQGFQRGGFVNLPWSAGSRDPYLGLIPGGGAFRFEGEEFFVNRASTAKLQRSNPGLLEYINKWGELPGHASGGRVSFKGKTFTALFAGLLAQAEKLAGQTMHISQGGFRPRTSYSGTSHQGDALDITGNFKPFIAPLRSLGIPAWDRTGKGNWAPHVHGIPLPGSGSPAGSAVWQGQDYLRGGDGLGGRDNGPRGGMIEGAIKFLKEALENGFSSVGDWFKNILGKLTEPFNNLTSGAGDTIFGDLVLGIGKKLKDTMGDWLKDKLGMGGGADRYASGALSTRRGLGIVGERGPELMFMNGTEVVLPAYLTSQLLNGRRSSGDYISSNSLKDRQGEGDVIIHNLQVVVEADELDEMFKVVQSFKDLKRKVRQGQGRIG